MRKLDETRFQEVFRSSQDSEDIYCTYFQKTTQPDQLHTLWLQKQIKILKPCVIVATEPKTKAALETILDRKLTSCWHGGTLRIVEGQPYTFENMLVYIMTEPEDVKYLKTLEWISSMQRT